MKIRGLQDFLQSSLLGREGKGGIWAADCHAPPARPMTEKERQDAQEIMKEFMQNAENGQ